MSTYKELFEIENEITLMQVGLDALLEQGGMVSNITNKAQAEILLPVLCNNLGTSIPAGEAFETIKKIGSGIVDGAKAVISKLIELVSRFIKWIGSFFKGTADQGKAIDKATAQVVSDLENDMDNIEKVAGSVTKKNIEQVNDIVKASKDNINDTFVESDVVVNAENVVIEPDTVTQVPVKELIKEKNISDEVHTAAPPKAEPVTIEDFAKREGFKPARAHNDLHELLYSPVEEPAFTDYTDSIYRAFKFQIDQYYFSITSTLRPLELSTDKELEDLLKGVDHITSQLLKTLEIDLNISNVITNLTGDFTYQVDMVTESLDGKILKYVKFTKVKRGNIPASDLKRRPKLAFYTDTMDDISSISEELKGSVETDQKKLEKMKEVLTKINKNEKEKTTWEELSDKEKSEIGTLEDHIREQDLLVKRQRLTAQFYNLRIRFMVESISRQLKVVKLQSEVRKDLIRLIEYNKATIPGKKRGGRRSRR